MADSGVSNDGNNSKLVNVNLKNLKKPGKPNKEQLLLVLLLALVLVGGVLGYQKYSELKRENQKLSNPQEAARVETDKLKASVAQLIEIPANEQPTVATVVDASKLKNQAFFRSAENGDKVLLFPQAKKAVLYRPSTNKIIEVAPINIGKNEKQKPAEGAQTQTQQQQTTQPQQ